MEINHRLKVVLILFLPLIMGHGINSNGSPIPNYDFSTKAESPTRTIELSSADGIRILEVYNADCISENPPVLTFEEAESILNAFVDADKRGDIDGMMECVVDIRGSLEDQRELYEVLLADGPYFVSAEVISVKEIPVDQLRKERVIQDENITAKEIPIEEIPAEVIEAQNHPENIIREVLKDLEGLDLKEYEEVLLSQEKVENKIQNLGTVWVAEVDMKFADGFIVDQMKFINYNGQWKMFVDGN